jgi:hypothetical protein
MDSPLYQKITLFCSKRLVKNLHDRHLEDSIQHVAMKVFQNEKQSWEYAFLDYLRQNGISEKYGKAGAKAIERAVFVGIDDDKDEENNRSFLLDVPTVEKFKEVEKEDASETVLSIIAEGLNILPERAQWVLENCQLSLRTR